MNYKKIASSTYNIHIINNKKFHTIDCRIYFTENVTRELVTYRNALINVLTYATKNYDTKSKLLKRCQDLYSLSPVASSYRNGNILTTKFSISTINSDYIDKNNLIENILLLREIILNPLVIDYAFDSKYFNITKKELEMETKTIIEEPRLYANLELLKLIDDNDKLISGYSDLKVLGKMTEKKLYQSYLEMLQNSKIDIFISGNIKNEKEVIKLIQDNFKFNNSCKLNDAMIVHNVKCVNPNTKIENQKYQQSKLSMGFKAFDLTNFENRYVSFIFNALFGGGANSLLMRYVREDNSLCYYINSYSNRMDNILIVNSGINKENYDLVVSLINEVLNNIKEGKISLNDVKEAKMEVLYNLSNIFESNRSIIEYYYGRHIFNSDDIKEKIKLFNQVNKEDIIKYANKLNMEGIFFLKGDL